MDDMKAAELPAIFQRNLKAVRQLRGLSQDSLAEKLQMSRISINRWEKGIQSPTLDTIVKIAEALEIPPEALLSEVGSEILSAATA